jgi:hypothetical protein
MPAATCSCSRPTTTALTRNVAARSSYSPDPRLAGVLARFRTAAQQSGTPWRMCEANSFSGGGLPGVSDTLIGALWTLDFMLLLAQQGCAGVNIETGVNQLGFLSYYSPIRNDSDGTASAGVPYYGMLAFTWARRGCTQMLPAEADLRGTNATAYILGALDTPRSVVVVNRDRAQAVRFSLRDLGIGRASVLRLAAPSADSTTGATFGHSQVDSDGHWSPASTEPLRDGIVSVPPMSAAVARANR